MKFKSSCLGVFFTCLLGVSATAQGGEFVLASVHIDNLRQAKTIFDGAKDCTNNSICKNILSAASSYYGIPADKVVAVAALLSSSGDSELTEMNIKLPPGYSYCKSSLHTTSIVTHDGPRGSTLLARADPRSLNVQTWTQVLPPGHGRTWVEADISIVGVSDALAEASYNNGSCFRPGNRIFLFCRGGGCENPRDTADSGQSVDPSTPPGANSRL